MSRCLSLTKDSFASAPRHIASCFGRLVITRRMFTRCIQLSVLFVPLLAAQAAPSACAVVGPLQSSPNVEKRIRGIELYRQGKFVEAIKVLQSAVKENKTDHEAWYYLGLGFFQQPKKIKDAIKAFETAIRLQPQFAAAHIALAYTSLRQNRFSEAVREARAALSIDPTLSEPHYIIGLVHLKAGDPEEALNEAVESTSFKSKLLRTHTF